jgi:hypothetical protein
VQRAAVLPPLRVGLAAAGRWSGKQRVIWRWWRRG